MFNLDVFLVVYFGGPALLMALGYAAHILYECRTQFPAATATVIALIIIAGALF